MQSLRLSLMTQPSTQTRSDQHNDTFDNDDQGSYWWAQLEWLSWYENDLTITFTKQCYCSSLLMGRTNCEMTMEMKTIMISWCHATKMISRYVIAVHCWRWREELRLPIVLGSRQIRNQDWGQIYKSIKVGWCKKGRNQDWGQIHFTLLHF